MDANDGNISVKISENQILCTPTGVSKGFMEETGLVKADLWGNALEGEGKPSTEIKMHAMVYRENPDVRAVVHAHPKTATAFAVAGIPLDKPILTEAVVLLGPIPLAPYAVPGTEEVPKSIEPFCRDYNGALLANHGALTWGEDLTKAWFLMEAMEHYAEILYKTLYGIGRANELTVEQVNKLLELYG
ncbi:3-oxo-tetronate 4-phosphate decarboxylase [bioreactor metagenome]|uniref:3-oxo-tetronate 4-phosphate decarboxylase n=1 Tax=bioreactor metagenome TaxID=1076179 RepID=A0A645HX24_9ZZZZ